MTVVVRWEWYFAMKKKLYTIFFGLLESALLLSGCVIQADVNTPDDTDAKMSNPPSIQQAVNAPDAMWLTHYYDMDSLIKASDIILSGRIISETPERRHDMVFTHHGVEILKVYYGDVQEGASITVLITGGKIDDIETIPYREAPLLETGAEYMLFLDEFSEVDYCIPTGGYQGVFVVTDDILRFVGERNDDIADEVNGMSVASMEKIIEEIIGMNTAHGNGMEAELPLQE